MLQNRLIKWIFSLEWKIISTETPKSYLFHDISDNKIPKEEVLGGVLCFPMNII